MHLHPASTMFQVMTNLVPSTLFPLPSTKSYFEASIRHPVISSVNTLACISTKREFLKTPSYYHSHNNKKVTNKCGNSLCKYMKPKKKKRKEKKKRNKTARSIQPHPRRYITERELQSCKTQINSPNHPSKQKHLIFNFARINQQKHRLSTILIGNAKLSTLGW